MISMDIPINSRVRVKTKEESFEGLFLPKEGGTLVLKLDSGYNIGIYPSSVQEINIIDEEDSSTKVIPEIEVDASLPRVRLLHTGGTIASKVDYETGGVVGKFTPEELLGLYPELQTLAHVDAQLLENMQSDDFRFSHFNIVAKEVLKAAQNGISRCIVTCGTDFLHYMSAALSFLLKDVPVGVLVVGSQRSSDRGSSDAFVNLMCATQFLVQSNFSGVGVCAHESSSDDACLILRGVNVRKMHTSARATFQAINDIPLARVEYPDLTIDLYQTLPLCEGEVPSTISLFNEELRVGMIYARPQLFAQEISAYSEYDGVVLVGSGLGHFPITVSQEHNNIGEEIKKLAEKMPVVLVSQCIYGRVNMNVYSPQRVLKAMGILGHQCSMIPETAYIKLSYLLSIDPQKVHELYEKDMIGEQPKTDMGGFL